MPENDKKTVDTSIKVDEKTKSNEVDKGATETEKVEKTEKVDETTKDTTQTPSGDSEKKESNDNVEEKTNEEETTEATEYKVEETEPQGNGISINDLVTKDMLAERLSALEAKFEAVVKENTDLKDKLSKSQEETNGLRDKYENKDFGNFNKQGVSTKNKDANETFESYSKQFM